MSLVRLQKALANATIYSRRKAEDLIVKGRVSVNGRIVAELGAKVDPDRDEIAVDGAPIPGGEKKVYILLYKPRGVVSTTDDPQNRPTVTSLLHNVQERIYPVGRLDMDSEGLLLLTNDGDLALKIMHPRYGTKKTYRVLLKTIPTSQQLEQLRKGVQLEEGETRPAQVDVDKIQGKKAWVKFVIGEGKKRQVRRMCAAVGLTVLRLKRVALGSLSLKGLKPGSYRRLKPFEVERLKSQGLSHT